MANTIFRPVTATVIKETEKAYQVKVSYWTKDTTPIKTADMWVPKSCAQTENGQVIAVADWILNKWTAQRIEYIKIKAQSNYAANHTQFNFDIACYNNRLAKREAEKQKYKDDLAKTLDTTVKFVKPYADLFMAQLAWDAKFVYEHYKDAAIIPGVFMCDIKKLAEEISKEFGIYDMETAPASVKAWWSTFVDKHDTFKSIVDYFCFEIYEARGVYNFPLYAPEYTQRIKYEDGQSVDTSMLYRLLDHGTADPSTSTLGKKFKKNWEFYNKFKHMVDTMISYIDPNK